MEALARLVRTMMFAVAIYLAVGLIMPSPGPFVVTVTWLLVMAVVLTIRPVRRWMWTGRIRRPAS
jgi:hypothetical protein